MNASALSTALKKRFGSGPGARRRVCRALGLDEGLLGAPAASGGNKAMRDLRVQLEALLSDMAYQLPEGAIAKILDFLDQHVDLGALPDDHPQAERVRSLGGADDEEMTEKKFRELLRQAGLSEPDIDKAFEIATSAAKDAKKARDDALGLPKPAPAGFGGRLGMDAAGALEAIRGTNADWAQATRRDDLGGVLGSALERLSKRRTVSPGVLERLAMDSAADAALRQAQGVERHHDDFERKHPEVARVF
jgi:hypothetical protein